MPIVKNEMVFGVIELDFNENTSVDMSFLFLMKIFGAQISLKLQNIVLNEQSQVNVEFHDSMKNIAKLIETQYELNYIVPLIGEMLDRFISDHLIYVFLKQEEDFRLVWPKACNDERIFEALKNLDKNYASILTTVYDALRQKGYNPINQIVGYILSEDPTYITNYNNARTLIKGIDRDELIAEMLKAYINK